MNTPRELGIRKRRAGAEDVEIGRKIRALRLERGLSQSGLAEGIGLTFQQVQKYEKGTNRVSAGRLQRIADILNTPVMFFYGGMGGQAKKRDPRNTSLAFLQTKGAVRLIRAYSEIHGRNCYCVRSGECEVPSVADSCRGSVGRPPTSETLHSLR